MKKKIILIGPAYPYRGGNALFITHAYESLKNQFDVKIYNYKLLYPSLLFQERHSLTKAKNRYSRFQAKELSIQ
ncbi:MAG: hypothetical protein M5T52_06815 [Ignavibacteriaceae bacterium]|nr:hypothetical protein [Ignavibacteriaceae bacterium]